MPRFEYLHPTDSLPWYGSFIDLLIRGALGFNLKKSVYEKGDYAIHNFPNPFSEKTTISLSGIEGGYLISMNIYNTLGEKILSKNFIGENSQILFERGNLATGVYYYQILNAMGKVIVSGNFIIV